MNETDIDALLSSALKRRDVPLPAPDSKSWEKLKLYFGCEFPDEFVAFHAVVGRYRFEGELLQVSHAENIRGEDTIVAAYEAELRLGSWPRTAVPFYSVGNGDYFCLSSQEGKRSRVFYIYHEDRNIEAINKSFNEWLQSPGALE